ncbi:hypothetical protein [Caudoviricetes sp.]|nr:hypothetical protein [Caudoviricetes sp.]UOF82217.1 hypothetical protein [Caudoviricetes sp.]UOF82447.1 hypothetical protein [Caudoviricetes sp.]UOF82646.1 hypothetical protein [Caudoviricetes sp.]
MKISLMSLFDEYRWLWIDALLFGWWYVFVWRRGNAPYFYRSLDATPPSSTNEGRWFFGASSYSEGG